MHPPILLTRPADAPPETFAEYRDAGGYTALANALHAPREAVIDAIERAHLRGRGGASFPAARKWRIAAAATSPTKFVVGNGGEHEPGSRKDRFLVERYPHRVVEGLLLCGYATGATHGYVYLIEDMAGPIASIERALEDLRAADLLGTRILGSSFTFDVTLHRGPPTYVAGEETAALNAIEGALAKPRKKPPYPGEAGLHGQPTTVNNVETLAHVPWILRHGADAYRAIGVRSSSGTMLFTLPDSLRNPGVVELPFGVTWRHLIETVGGGLRDGGTLRAILPALSCAFVSAEHLDTSIDHDTLKELGSSPGCGGVTLITDRDDVLARLHEIARFFMAEQCGQCPPCRMETNQLAHVLAGVRDGKPGDYAGAITKVTAFARGKGMCSLIEMAAAPIVSGLRLFADDFASAIRPDGGGAAPLT